MKIAYICCVCHSEFRIILRQDGTESGEKWNKYGHISNWMGAAIQLARKWHERAREGTSRLLALLCVADSESVTNCCGVVLQGISHSFSRGICQCMNPNGRKQQSTEHERLRRDGSSIQLMCTSTGRHEGFWKRMGVLIHMCARVLILTAIEG